MLSPGNLDSAEGFSRAQDTIIAAATSTAMAISITTFIVFIVLLLLFYSQFCFPPDGGV
jgi:hypothetical protein